MEIYRNSIGRARSGLVAARPGRRPMRRAGPDRAAFRSPSSGSARRYSSSSPGAGRSRAAPPGCRGTAVQQQERVAPPVAGRVEVDVAVFAEFPAALFGGDVGLPRRSPPEVVPQRQRDPEPGEREYRRTPSPTPAAYSSWGHRAGFWGWGNPPTPVLDGGVGEGVAARGVRPALLNLSGGAAPPDRGVAPGSGGHDAGPGFCHLGISARGPSGSIRVRSSNSTTGLSVMWSVCWSLVWTDACCTGLSVMWSVCWLLVPGVHNRVVQNRMAQIDGLPVAAGQLQPVDDGTPQIHTVRSRHGGALRGTLVTRRLLEVLELLRLLLGRSSVMTSDVRECPDDRQDAGGSRTRTRDDSPYRLRTDVDAARVGENGRTDGPHRGAAGCPVELSDLVRDGGWGDRGRRRIR